MGEHPTFVEVFEASHTDYNVTNGTPYFYVVTAWEGGTESQESNEVMVTPASILTAFVTSKTLGTPRNTLPTPPTAWLGMAVQVGPSPLTIVTLGRAFAPGNSQIHVVKIVEAATDADLPGGSVMVNMAGGTVAGDFVYARLASPVTLNPNASYFVVGQETMGGDQYYDNDTMILTTSAAVATSSIYGDGTSYLADGPAGQTYGPVDFQY